MNVRVPVPRLVAAEPDESDTEGDNGDAEPAIAADALVKKQLCAKCASRVAERAERDDKTNLAEGQNREKRKKAEGHQRNSHPHPRQAECLKDETNERAGTEIVNFTDAFHGAADAELAAGASHNDEKEKERLEHG